MDFPVALTIDTADPYLLSVVELNNKAHAILLRVYADGYYTSLGFVTEVHAPAVPVHLNEWKGDLDIYVIYNAVAATCLPINMYDITVHRCNYNSIDNKMYMTEETFDLKEIDWNVVWSLCRQDKPGEDKPVYWLSDGSHAEFIGIHF